MHNAVFGLAFIVGMWALAIRKWSARNPKLKGAANSAIENAGLSLISKVFRR